MARATTGYLVLADISGYTRYLSSSEIDQGPAIAADLLEVVVNGLRPVVKLAKLEGDAGFFAGPEKAVRGSELLDALEGTYASFRRRIRSLRDSTSCTCAACSLVGDLDLKFFVHYGTWVRHRIAGHEELAGTDVIVAHRLLKGAAGSHVSLRGTALLTDPAIAALAINPAALGLRAFAETYDELGAVTGQVIDLGERWETARVSRRATAGAHERLLDETVTLPAPPEVAWEWLSAPARRGRWDGQAPIEIDTVGGRRGLGTTSQCVVGRLSTIEEVIEWRPYERLARRARVGRLGPLTWTWDLHPASIGTELRLRWTRPVPAGHPRPVPNELVAEQRAALSRLAAAVAGAGPG
jgi:hypothetical protein